MQDMKWDGELAVKWKERVQHITCRASTCDDELSFARTVSEQAESITIETVVGPDPRTTVTVYTQQAVYHFHKLRADYEGHASRMLQAVLASFGVRLPLAFLIQHPNQTIYLTGAKVVAGDQEYRLGKREEGYKLVESLHDWWLASDVVNTLLAWARAYEMDPVVLLEQTIRLLDERLQGEADSAATG